ncbi:anti-phage-associated helicase HerA [Vagococcus fessus]|uniref:Bipolar DNA helicase n=1 Tax=Vagococcus fessus TaxID=120370 RepID=A0A430A7L1_9ENTE|nr:anti-phage-associated helicase HerA [Vagococcus fessus]RSU03069.1 Bipolar DNA helicase [Vagococcus fessus]
MSEQMYAEVIAVFPDKVKISVDNLEDYQRGVENLKIGSYLKIVGNDESIGIITIIENFIIEAVDEDSDNFRKHIIEARPLGVINGNEFVRGGDSIALPPKGAIPATKEDINKIYCDSVEEDKRFIFSKLSSNKKIEVPVDGDKFFNKHIAIVGSTGSGKSHSVASILQKATTEKNKKYDGINNSHIMIFDIHSEYRTAFPKANYLDIENLLLPYWLLNSEELQELFLDTEGNDHRQRSVFKDSVVKNKIYNADSKKKDKIHFDSVIKFDINETLQYIKYKNIEKKDKSNNILWKKEDGDEFILTDDNINLLFEKGLIPAGTSKSGLNGELGNFIDRLENKINDKRLDFIFGEKAKNVGLSDVLEQLLSYGKVKSNVTILDLSGIPFEVLSITVSLISRLMFDYGYLYKQLKARDEPDKVVSTDTPLLLVYEEAHKYIPRSGLSKYRSSKESIERIAKEGRKYGVSLLLASQRPSEISETIFSQCNNFLALRLTNPNDQNYVKRLLPDTLGSLADKMSALRAGEALLAGEAVVMPSIVQIDRCSPEPSSTDINYFELWKQEWKDVNIENIKEIWENK